MTNIPSILLIDDKPANIIALENHLNQKNRTIRKALNGEEAFALLLNEQFDLIILNVQMQGMSGFEMLHVLKRDNWTKDIPIIFLMAELSEQSQIMKELEESNVDYIFTPINPDLLKTRVNVLLKLQLQKKYLLEEKEAIQKTAENNIKKLNQDLRRHVIELEVTNKELESFSYSVSHDLRAPLRAINGYSSILKEELGEDASEETIRILDTIQKNATKMGVLIEDLLAFSRLGRKEIVKSDCNMNSIVKSVLEEINSSTRQKISISMENLAPCSADTALIKQVWTNLISNAVKFSSKKKTSKISVGSNIKDEEIVYFIEDNGAGFDMRYVEKLFGVFKRLHRTEEFEGTGVGLAIVQRIVTRHGGRVWAESRVDKGATFYFTLPIVVVPLQ